MYYKLHSSVRAGVHRFACLSVALFVAGAIGGSARPALAEAVVAAATDEHALALRYLQRWQAETGAPGVSACVAANGKIVFSGGVGLADLQAGTPQNGRSVHNIGSISKTQALVAIMQLVEQGKVALDADIRSYLSWFPEKPWPITLRQILTHTSGIRHYKRGEFGPDNVLAFRHYQSFEESTRFWRDDPLEFEPGKHWMYSSFATNVLQGIVESVTGESFEDYLTVHVWRPAGMADTRFDVPSRIVPRRGQGYESWDGVLHNAQAEDVSYKYAGGGVISTDEDLCRFGIALNAGRLLKRDTLMEVYRLQLPRDTPYSPAAAAAYAKQHPGQTEPSQGRRQGLIFGDDRNAAGQRFSGHAGSVKGTESRFTNYHQDGVVVALHFNISLSEEVLDSVQAAEALAQLYLPEPGQTTQTKERKSWR